MGRPVLNSHRKALKKKKHPPFRANTGRESRCDTRKRCRKRAAFAGLQRQSPLTTTKGACGPFPCTPIKIGPFPVQSSPGPRSGQDPSGVLDRLGGLRSRAGASLTRPQPVPQDFGCRKCEKGRSKPWWLARPFEHFVRQNPKAEPLFSYATPAKGAVFIRQLTATVVWTAVAVLVFYPRYVIAWNRTDLQIGI